MNLVFAADAVIRFKNGSIFAHTTSSSLPPFQTDQAALIGWLCQFSRPTFVHDALKHVAPEQKQFVEKAVQYLLESGVLVSANQSIEEYDDRQTHINRHLKLLARHFYDLACDVHAYGPNANRFLAERTGISLEQRLLALASAADGIRSELLPLRSHYVKTQLAHLHIDENTKHLKLHIGSGSSAIDGWVNIDIHPAPLALNVHWGLPFADGSVDYVFVSHLLEHLFYPNDVGAFFDELFRVLAPKGVIRVVVPDIEQCIEAYTKNDAQFFQQRQQHWGGDAEQSTRLQHFLAYAGAGPDPFYLFEAHKFGYDFETLSKTLATHQFQNIVRSEYMKSEHDALKLDVHSEVAGAKYGDRYYSLFVEAQKPSYA
jgi:predicted SAM-dependent methyltransferase